MSDKKITKSWLATFEGGRIKHPSPDKLELLADLLNTDIAEIYAAAGISVHRDSPTHDDQEKEIMRLFRTLPSELKPAALRILQDLKSAISIERAPARTAADERETYGAESIDTPLPKQRRNKKAA